MVLISRAATVRARTFPRTGTLIQRQRHFTLYPTKSQCLTILSGLAGGAITVVVGGYIFYHWSGLKDLVDAARYPIRLLKQLPSQKARTAAPSSDADTNSLDATTQILVALRLAAKAQVAVLPGAGILVDLAFNGIEKVAGEHKDEALVILKSAFEDMQEVVRVKGADYKAAAWETLLVLRIKLAQVQALAGEAGRDKIGPLFDRLPELIEHAPKHIFGTRDSPLPRHLEVLEKGRGILSKLSKKIQPVREADPSPSEKEPETTSSSTREKDQRTQPFTESQDTP